MSNPLSTVEPWSIVAEGYVKSTKQFLEAYSKKAMELLNLNPNDIVLDVATGPGTLALPLSKTVREVIAIDFSESMIAQLKKGMLEINSKNIIPFVMDGQNLKFSDNHFDAAFSMFGLMFFPDKLQGLKEIYRVLKPGKKIAVSGWAPVSHSPLMQCWFGAFRKANPEIPEPQTNPISFENPEYFEEQLDAAGFTKIEIVPFSNSIKVLGAEEFLNTMLEGSAPLQLMKSKMETSVWHEKYGIMLDHLRGQLTKLPISLSSEAYIATAQKPE
ncbi:class I SAM-dependent methyltransferase [Leptospira sp. WS92.C1]